MIKRIAISLFLATLKFGGFASDRTVIHVSKDVEMLVPKGSPVGNWRIGEYGVITYKGQFYLSGSYRYGWITDDANNSDYYNNKSLTFLVDKNDSDRLPYWTRDEPIRHLYIENPSAFVKAVIGANRLDQLNARKIKSVSGRATILVADFKTAIECDHQNNSARFISVRQSKALTSLKMAQENSC